MTGALLAGALLVTGLASAQSAKTWIPPHTADGQPDLQGVWSSGTTTPLERPAEFAGKATLTAAEAAEFQKKAIYDVNGDRCDGGGAADVGRAYNEFWRERGKVVPDLRTSLITDPPDGKIPPLTPEAQKRQADRAAAARGHEFDGPENRSLQERCLVANNAGPPMRTGADTLLYEFTVDDPATFGRPWAVKIPTTRAEGVMYEFACHEGNYGMTGALSGARVQEGIKVTR